MKLRERLARYSKAVTIEVFNIAGDMVWSTAWDVPASEELLELPVTSEDFSHYYYSIDDDKSKEHGEVLIEVDDNKVRRLK